MAPDIIMSVMMEAVIRKRLAGEDIPIHARIIGIADAYDAMATIVYTAVRCRMRKFLKN